MRTKLIVSAFAFILAASPFALAQEGPKGQSTTNQVKETPEQQRAAIQKHVQETLSKIYQLNPEAKEHIAKAPGYAVFKTGGVQVLLLGAGAGDGLAISGDKQTYMKMVQGKAGLGVGVKDTRQVFVFSTQAAYEQFVNKGWTGTAEAAAAAKTDTKGKAISGAKYLGKGVYLYELTDAGLVAEATVVGSKYYKDAKLNKK
ncbi:lipid-binding SYLF domain-containing protein [Deefgea rivuli]|jgi:lipid-binding SYLF domain-containing protein|uniref:lipid-binding SYLF domain-containing protein n=1 Tax=Deefgea rivuli TaxID=400948 RepID=UPI000686852A|nr:YSC84-related protein [Deefgea rivuli]